MLSLADTENTALPDEMAVIVLAGGGTYAEAGTAIGMSERTIKRRMAEESFRQRVAEARSSMVQRTAGMLSQATVVATETLLELMDPSMPPTVRLGAARTVLDAEPDYRETDALLDRLQALEDGFVSSGKLAS